MKFTFFKLLACFAGMVFLLAGCSNPSDRHRYKTSDFTASAETLTAAGCMEMPIDDYLTYAVLRSDLIVTGVVMDDGLVQKRLIPAMKDVDEYIPPDSIFYITTTSFTIGIKDVWFGEYEAETLVLELMGPLESGTLKPHKNDQLVLMLQKYDDGSYALVHEGLSLYVENPPTNRLLSFSAVEDYTAYNGKTAKDLKEGLTEKLDAVSQQGTTESIMGAVGRQYQKMYEEKVGIADSES